MNRDREISVGIGTHVLPDGRKIVTNIIKYNVGVITSETAEHETDHGLAAELTGSPIDIMTIVPGHGYRGKTVFKGRRLNPISAAAAASQNRDGVSWDRYITVVHGHNWEASKSAAKDILEANADVHGEISKELEVQKTLTSLDIWRVIDRTRNPEARITEFDSRGREVRTLVERVRKVDGAVPYFIEEPLEDRKN